MKSFKMFFRLAVFVSLWGLGFLTYAQAPQISSISPANGPTAGGTSLTISGMNFTGISESVTVGGKSCTGYTFTDSTTLSCTTPAAAGNNKAVVVTNLNGSSNSALFSYDPPTITSISPTTGPAAGGTTLTINGTNFDTADGTTQVTIGGNTCMSLTVISANQLTCTAPAGTAGNANVAVSTASGSSGSSPFTYTAPPPQITSISPTNGTTAGGASLTITGTGFTGGAESVSVGGKSCTGYTFIDSTTISCATPAASGNNIAVIVTNSNGSSNSALFSYDPPTITSISPTSGPVAGGTTLTVSGTNFDIADGTTQVQVGSNMCSIIAITDANQLTCTTPAGSPGNANVAVSTASGSSGISVFSYYAATIPSTPSVTATAGNGQVTLVFATPSDGGSALTGYTIDVNSGTFILALSGVSQSTTTTYGPLTATITSVSGGNTEITITGLTNGIPYSFTITATNTVGSGSASTSTGSITPLAPSSGGGGDPPPPPPPPPPPDTTVIDPTVVITPVTDPGTVFSNPQGSTTSGGIVIISSVPTTPLAISPAAPAGAVIQINTTQPVPIIIGNTQFVIQPLATNTLLQVQTFGTGSALQVAAGTANITAPVVGSSIPIIATNQNTVVMQTQASNTQVTAGRDQAHNLTVAVNAGTVLYQVSSSRRSADTVIVYAGEAVNIDNIGELQSLRLGTFAQDQGKPGDYIPAIPLASENLQVPILSGTPARFNIPLEERIGQIFINQFGLTPLPSQSLSQDPVTGIITFPTEQGIFRIIPIGPIQILFSRGRAVSVADIAANLTAILDATLSFAVAPAVAYDDLSNVLKQIDTSSSLEVLGDGAILATLNGVRYVAIPDPAMVPGGEAQAGIETLEKQLALRDKQGNRQILYPAFADSEHVLSTFKPIMPKVTLRYIGTGEYQALQEPGATPMTLVPDIGLSAATGSQVTQPWWLDLDKIYIRYPDNSVQGFSVK